MIERKPNVTVLMPVYNGEPYILEAVKSVLNQSFVDFELLLIDDCSSDNGLAIITSIADARIRVERNEKNLGLATTLNKGIALARGELIARMDQDDICCPERLRLQVEFLERHPDVAVCGCGVEVFYEDGRTHRHYFPLSYGAVKVEALFNSPISHPGAMIRKSLLLSGSYRYDETPYCVEDYDLFSRILHVHKVVNLPHFLLYYRVSGNSETARADAPQRAAVRKVAITRVQVANLAKAGFHPTARQLDLHYLLSLTSRLQTLRFEEYALSEIKSYLYALRHAVTMNRFADRPSSCRVIGKVFLKVVLYRARSLSAWQVFSAFGSSLLWYGLHDAIRLRVDYFFRIKRH